MSIEAMKQAIETLELANYQICDYCGTTLDEIEEAITALRQAIEQAEKQEPAAWVLEWTFNGEEKGRRLYDDETHCVFDAESDGGVCRPLVYGDTSPPPRQPLTDEQVWDAYMEISAEFDCNVIDLVEFARAIEAAHGIKGEA